MNKEVVKIPSKLFYGVTLILLSAAVGFNTWAVTAVYARPTEDKVKELIITNSPYVADQRLILDFIERNTAAIDANTKAVIQMQVALDRGD